ncbi:MAG: hypothetical protein EBS07_06060 [Sphingobacteriia bacterium]|nr:hypothetical protein [Sphingobacteriia bacterium]
MHVLSALVLSACPEPAEGKSKHALRGVEEPRLEIAGHISASSMRAFRPFDFPSAGSGQALRAGKLNDRPAMTRVKIFF